MNQVHEGFALGLPISGQYIDYAIAKAQERIERSGLPKVLADRLALGI